MDLVTFMLHYIICLRLLIICGVASDSRQYFVDMDDSVPEKVCYSVLLLSATGS